MLLRVSFLCCILASIHQSKLNDLPLCFEIAGLSRSSVGRDRAQRVRAARRGAPSSPARDASVDQVDYVTRHLDFLETSSRSMDLALSMWLATATHTT